MRDDGLGPHHVDISAPLGWQFIGITELEIIKVRLHRDGSITGGVQKPHGIIGPHQNYAGHILPLVMFELNVGEVGWLRFKPRRPWVLKEVTAVTHAPILWIDAQPLAFV